MQCGTPTPTPIPRLLTLDQRTVLALSQADAALGQLQGLGHLVRDPQHLIGPYVTREALASTRIEGTQASLAEVLQSGAEEGGEPRANVEDIAEVQAYVRATYRGFETIHPFLDGNGRIGRLLIGLLLHQEGRLTTPLLYLSGYLEMHRREYYERLQAVRERGEVQQWLQFFLTAVKRQAEDGVDRAGKLVTLRDAEGRGWVRPLEVRGRRQYWLAADIFQIIEAPPLYERQRELESAGDPHDTRTRHIEDAQRTGAPL